jgi:hypothetical protein
MNKKLPSYLLGKSQIMGTITFSVLFAIIFLNIYIPFSDTAWFGLGQSDMFSGTLIFVFVSIMTLVISRTLMYRTKHLFELSYLEYILWCIAEIVVISAFYTSLTVEITGGLQEKEIEIFGRSILYGFIALGIPYLISGMYLAINDKNNIIRLMSYDNVVTDEIHEQDTSTQKITLFDNSGSLKMSVNINNLYYIESDDNYIKVWYTDNKGELKQYMLRCRLKTVEDSFKGSALVRCNRKYIVNIKKVSTLRKEGSGYILDLGNEMIPPLPVTKTYTDSILSYFRDESPLLEVLED